MVVIEVKKQKLVDFSFMPSLKCSLSCAHCMYEASPDNTTSLDIEKTKKFISTFDWDKINAIGFYGGEISCDYETYQKFIDLIPKEVVKFTITNGVWPDYQEFINFVNKNNLQVFISTTKFHKPHQNLELLVKLASENNFILKGDDHIIPMGRSKKSKWECSQKCSSYKSPMRLTLNPYGNIMFCNCDGIYPIVGTYDDRFDLVVENTFKEFCEKK